VNSLSSYIKLVISVLIIFPITDAFAYEATTTGDSFSSSKDNACKQALDKARESAAQQARVFVSSKYERRIKYLSGDVVENVTHQTYQSTFGITELDEIINKKSKYDEDTGSITCHIEAKFNVDTDVVAKELEARISLEEAKIKEANRKSLLLTTLKNNESSYTKIKEKANKYATSVYTGSVICKDSYSVKDCKNELIEKFEQEKGDEVAQDLDILDKYVTIAYDDFEGDEEHKALEKYDDAFVITMTGDFIYSVDVSDPYIEENNRIINELALVNGYKTNGSNSIDDKNHIETEAIDESGSFFSNIIFDFTLMKGDLLGTDEYLEEGKSEAYINALIQFGIMLDVGGGYNKNLFRVTLYSGKLNIYTCQSVGLGNKCDSSSTIDTKVKGIGLDKIFESASLYVNIGGVFYRVEDKDIIGTDFFQIKAGISTKALGPYLYADISSMIPTSSNTEFLDIGPSFDLILGVGVRF